MCELLVGLPDVSVLGVDDATGVVRVHIETRGPRPCCAGCGGPVIIKDRPVVELVDLAVFGRQLVWHKQRWACVTVACPVGSFTGEDRRIAAPRLALTDRAGRWVTEQVGGGGAP
jgi:transposase